jgi:hypothetical protein
VTNEYASFTRLLHGNSELPNPDVSETNWAAVAGEPD